MSCSVWVSSGFGRARGAGGDAPRSAACAANSGDVFYYFQDALGSTHSLTNATGTVCYDADFYPFGGELTFTNTCGQSYKFAGMRRDATTGLDHTRFRQYSSNLGRWYSPDPLGGEVTNPQSLNRYAYVLNNPTTFIDPLGMYLWTLGECTYDTASFYVDSQYQGTDTEVVWCMTPLSFIQPVLPDILSGGGRVGGSGGRHLQLCDGRQRTF